MRLPDERISRRFERGAPLRLVRQWAESALPLAIDGGRFELVSTHPRFVAREDNDELTLVAAGLADGAVVLNFHGFGFGL